MKHPFFQTNMTAQDIRLDESPANDLRQTSLIALAPETIIWLETPGTIHFILETFSTSFTIRESRCWKATFGYTDDRCPRKASR